MKNDKALPIGKIDSDILKKIVFDNINYKRKEVRTRPGIGEDCAVLDFGQYECVMSTDPITAAIQDIGRLSIHISCNDIASNGIEPLGIMLAVMLPIGTTEEDIDNMMKQAGAAAEACSVEIIGGHTEITGAVNTPVIVSTAVGRALLGKSQSAKDMKSGDKIYITKTAGIEGTGIIACDFEKELGETLTAEELEYAKTFLDRVSVVPEGVIAGKIGTAGMHDITEGGILGAVWEMCSVSGTGAKIYEEKIPVEDVTKKICDKFHINYLRLISSGCMLIVVPTENTETMEEKMADAKIQFTCIGEVKSRDYGIMLEKTFEELSNIQKRNIEIEPPASDELYKVIGR